MPIFFLRISLISLKKTSYFKWHKSHSRAISLGVRLAANLSAGHLLFVILAS